MVVRRQITWLTRSRGEISPQPSPHSNFQVEMLMFQISWQSPFGTNQKNPCKSWDHLPTSTGWTPSTVLSQVGFAEMEDDKGMGSRMEPWSSMIIIYLDLPEVFEEKLKLTSSTLKYWSIRIFWQHSDHVSEYWSNKSLRTFVWCKTWH